MNRNILETLLGAVVVGIAVIFVIFSLQFVDTKSTQKKYVVYAYFDNVGGLKSGADVRLNGVLVGNVESVSINMDRFKAEVKMHIHTNIILPSDSLISIADSSLLGGKYIRLNMGKQNTLIQQGGTFENVKNVVSLEQMLGKLIFLGTQ